MGKKNKRQIENCFKIPNNKKVTVYNGLGIQF